MSLITVVTPAARRSLTTVERYREASPESELLDAQIEAMIGQATAKAESYCNRVFARERVVETFYGTDAMLFLTRIPVTTIHSVTVNGTLLTVDTHYRLEDDKAGLLKMLGIGGAYTADYYDRMMEGNYGWPTAPAAPVKTEVNYTGGWLMPDATDFDLPADLENATQSMVRELSERMDSIRLDVTSEKLGDASWTYGGAAASIPGGSGGSQTFDVLIRPILDRYRVVPI